MVMTWPVARSSVKSAVRDDAVLHWHLVPGEAREVKHMHWVKPGAVWERASAGDSETKIHIPSNSLHRGHPMLHHMTHDADDKLQLPDGKEELHLQVGRDPTMKPEKDAKRFSEHWTVVYMRSGEIRFLGADGQPTTDWRGAFLAGLWLKRADFSGCDLSGARKCCCCRRRSCRCCLPMY